MPATAGASNLHSKADGGRRPLGVPTLEDKIVQGAVAEVLSAIYEADFLGFSYGFRPGRSAHHALHALHTALMTRKVLWVLDADIRSFFDSVDHEWLLRVVSHRIADPRILRLIGQWLRAGVMEGGEWTDGSFIAELLGQFQEPEFYADDFLFLCHVVISVPPEAGTVPALGENRTSPPAPLRKPTMTVRLSSS